MALLLLLLLQADPPLTAGPHDALRVTVATWLDGGEATAELAASLATDPQVGAWLIEDLATDDLDRGLVTVRVKRAARLLLALGPPGLDPLVRLFPRIYAIEIEQDRRLTPIWDLTLERWRLPHAGLRRLLLTLLATAYETDRLFEADELAGVEVLDPGLIATLEAYLDPGGPLEGDGDMAFELGRIRDAEELRGPQPPVDVLGLLRYPDSQCHDLPVVRPAPVTSLASRGASEPPAAAAGPDTRRTP